jgi:hypothetical protein
MDVIFINKVLLVVCTLHMLQASSTRVSEIFLTTSNLISKTC